MIFLLIFLLFFATQTFMHFLMRAYVYQQTIHQYYVGQRKKELIVFAVFNHISTILARCQDQHVLQEEQKITFSPIYISESQSIVINAHILYKNNSHEIILMAHVSDGTQVKYMGNINLGSSNYKVEKFEKIST